MEQQFKILQGAVGFDIKTGTAYVTVPLPRLTENKGKWQVENEVFIVTNDYQYWPITQEEQKRKSTFIQTLPHYPLGKEYWRKRDIEHFVINEGQPKVDPYTDVFEPTKEILDESIDFHDTLDSTILTLWIMGTYLLPIFHCFPYILLSGTRGSGKTKALEAISYLAFNAEMTSNATPSSIFRIIQSNSASILIDEGELLTAREDSQEMRLILNAGYKRNNPVCRTHKETHAVEWFDTFSPKIIAAINPPDPTLKSRCLQITMVRTADKAKGNKRINERTADWATYRDSLYRYALQCIVEVKEIFDNDEEINILECRQNELWSPLLAIAKHINLYVSTTIFDNLKEKALQDNDVDDTLDDWHKTILQILGDIVDLKRPYSIKEIKYKASDYIEDSEELQKMTSRWVGAALGRFGLKKGKRKEEGNTYIISREEVEDLLNSYQLKDEEKDVLPEHTVDGSSEVVTNEDIQDIFSGDTPLK